MDRDGVSEFLAVARWVSLCVEDGEGALRLVPAWARGSGRDVVDLDLPAGVTWPPTGRGRACLVADEFVEYTGIRGVIVRGVVDTSDPESAPTSARWTLSVTRADGFTFEGTTVSL